ncbi:hypothetical protein EWM64_g5172 [Hericium alpestre]|uniref:Uncharacterized protein n=1 Tax=Hericium alpestre TaxID=135208 RepID=A0A4Y9ZXN7_9AGAM|nr:hypothetical protein EWM64_g5172 [Hericium alpestre]
MEAPFNHFASSANISYNEVATTVHLAPIRCIGPYSNTDSVKDAVRRYDEELTKLAETASSIATQRNAVAHNPRIPPEILSRIFRHVIDLYPATHDGPPPHERMSSYRSWLICHCQDGCRSRRSVVFDETRLSTGRRISAAAFELTTSGRGAGIKLWRSEAGNPDVPEREPFITFLFIPTTTLMAAVLPLLRELVPRLHLPDLRILSISCCFSGSRRIREFRATVELLTRLLGHFTGVQHLIFNMRAADLLHQLMRAADLAPPDPRGGSKDGNHADLACFFRELIAISLLDTECGANGKAYEMLQELSVSSHIPDAKFFEAFTPHLVALRQEGHLQSLNFSWDDLEDWRSRFMGIVPVQPAPVEMQRYMDWQ